MCFCGVMDSTMVFGTGRQGFDNPHNKIISICFHGEMDITIDFGSIIEGSSPSGSTINPLYLGLSSDFVVARFFYLQNKNSNPQINKLSTYGFDIL